MKIIVVGDTHGHDTWRKIADQNTYDKFVFVGDYFDSMEIAYHEQLYNFNQIVDFKTANPDKVVCLFGNHDFHYLRGISESYSGFQPAHRHTYRDAIDVALSKGALQMCHVHDNFLFVHAGVTKTWCLANDIDESNVEQSINDLFKYRPARFEFRMGENFSATGDDVCQTPIWVRPRSLMRDKINFFTQIVGHTTVRAIQDHGVGMIMVDALHAGEFAIIEDGVFSVGRVKEEE